MENKEEIIQQLKELKQITVTPEKEIDLEKGALLLLRFKQKPNLVRQHYKKKAICKTQV